MLTATILTLAMTTALTAPPEAGVTVTQVKSFSHIRATAVATAMKGSRFAVASEDNMVRIMDAKTMKTVFQLTGHPRTPKAVCFSPNGKYLLTGDESARIWLWDARTGKKIREFSRDRGHTRGIQSFAFTKDGKRFASVGGDDVIKIWNLSGGHPKFTIKGNGANFYGAAFLPSGALVCGTLAEGMRMYEPKKFALAAKMSVGGGQGANGIAVNPAGTLAVTAGRDGRNIVWNLKTRKQVGSIKAHNDWVYNVAFSPNGRVAVSSSADTKVVVWDVKTFKKLATISGRSFVDSVVAITGDGKYILSTDSGNVLQLHKLSPAQSK